MKAHPHQPRIEQPPAALYGPDGRPADRAQPAVTPVRQNPMLGDVGNRRPWNIYDELDVAAGASTGTEFRFFSDPISSSKTKAKTNMRQSSRLPNPEVFSMTSLGFSVNTDIAVDDAHALLKNFYFEFWVSGKVYCEGRIVDFARGAGLYGHNSDAGNAHYSIGLPMLDAGVNWGQEFQLDIAQGEEFYCVAIGTAFTAVAGASGGTGINLRCTLDGIKTLAVN